MSTQVSAGRTNSGSLPRLGRFGRLARVVDSWTAPHGVDRYLELIRPEWSTSEVRARVVAVDRQTPDTVTLTLRPNANWTGFDAGQYTMLTVEIDGVRHTRCYSMTNSQHSVNGTIELTVKRHPQGLVSNHLVDRAAPGLVVGLSPAAGEFTLPAIRPRKVLLISGGSGITPVMSMLRTLANENASTEVTFLHYCLTPDDLVYRDDLTVIAATRPNVRILRVFTDEPGTGDLDGFLTQAHLDAADPEWRSARTYVCGPAPLMDAAKEIFVEAGVYDRLHTEAFTLAGLATAAPGDTAGTDLATGTLRFATSSLSVDNDGTSILDQAEGAGLRPAHGCRMGICHTCPRRMNAGTVRNVITGEVTTGADLEIRICVNSPVGDVDIDL